MNFSSLLESKATGVSEPVKCTKAPKIVEGVKESPKDLLRGAGFKIKTVTPTSFGVEIEFATKYPDQDIEDVLQDFTIKLKGRSVFVVD